MRPPLSDYIAHRLDEGHEIPASHRDSLDRLRHIVETHLLSADTPRLVFICTHNSRRSQMAQVWAQVAADYFSVSPVEAYSAGTEATAFDARAVGALQRAGCIIERQSQGDNPIYRYRIGPDGEPLRLFSKALSDPSLPTRFTAVMTCSAADEACPTVHGASARVALPYDDPQRADGTPGEGDAYDECCRRISRDLMFLFSHVAQATGGTTRRRG